MTITYDERLRTTGLKYVDIRTLHPFVIIQKPEVLLCCYDILHLSLICFHKDELTFV